MPNEFGEREYNPLPQNKNPKEIVKEYQQETNPKLNRYGKQIVNKNFYNLLKALVIIFTIAVMIFGILAYNGDIGKDLICEQQVCNCPNITCPSCPSCPSDNISLKCGDVNFPSELDINLENQS